MAINRIAQPLHQMVVFGSELFSLFDRAGRVRIGEALKPRSELILSDGDANSGRRDTPDQRAAACLLIGQQHKEVLPADALAVRRSCRAAASTARSKSLAVARLFLSTTSTRRSLDENDRADPAAMRRTCRSALGRSTLCKFGIRSDMAR